MAFQAAHRGRYICICLCSLLVCQTQLGLTQKLCFSTPIFSCRGAYNESEDCCSEGYLAFRASGGEQCFPCRGNVICHSNTMCQASTESPLGLGPMTQNDCCITRTDGMAYTDSSVVCNLCPPRPTTITTPQTSTEISTTEVTTTSSGSSEGTTSEMTETQTGSNTSTATNVGVIVGAVIAALVLVAAITTIIVTIVVVVVIKR